MEKSYYNKIKELVNEKGLPLVGTNENGENVIIEERFEDETHAYVLTTLQRNDWRRINTYYSDGTSDETYEK